MRKPSLALIRRICAVVPEVEDHDVRAIWACLALAPVARARRADAERALHRHVHPVRAPGIRMFKSAREYRCWQNRQPDIGGWQWRVLLDRVAGRRSMPPASQPS